MRSSKHALYILLYRLQRRHGLAELSERGAVVPAKRRRVNPLQPERVFMILAENLHLVRSGEGGTLKIS